MSEIAPKSKGPLPLESRFMGKPQQKSPEQKLREVSDMYEKHFLREMTKAMRSTVHESGFIQANQAEKIFREQLDDQYVEKWGERGGIGLSDMIYDQLMDKFGTMLGVKAPVEKPRGVIAINGKTPEMLPVKSFSHPGKPQALSYKVGSTQLKAGSEGEVQVPWSGTLLNKKVLPDEQIMIEIQHDNGLKSQMVYRGDAGKIYTGQKLAAGETLGRLNSDQSSIYWTVEKVGEKAAGKTQE